jgi:uncharacterized repeat protein (TIGR01451 family)
VPASGNYSIRVTDVNKQPLTPLYGTMLSGFPLGTGNPGDAGVQLGLHIAIQAQDDDGRYAVISTWNSPSVGSMALTANKAAVKVGDQVTFTLALRNETPVLQRWGVTLPMPEGTTFVKGLSYDRGTRSIAWDGLILPNATMKFTYTVRVNKGVAAGTALTATARLSDEIVKPPVPATVTVVK